MLSGRAGVASSGREGDLPRGLDPRNDVERHAVESAFRESDVDAVPAGGDAFEPELPGAHHRDAVHLAVVGGDEPQHEERVLEPGIERNAVLTRLTMIGGLYLVLVCLMPEFLRAGFNVPFFFGGTSLLIVVVVVMDFMAQIQAHLTSHQDEGLMKQANLKGGPRGGISR